MNRFSLSNFWDSYFSSYGEFGEFSLTFTAAMNGRSAVAVCIYRSVLCVKESGSLIILK